MELKILKNTGVSLVKQICDQIRNNITTGKLKPGKKLPSLRDLEKDTGIGRCTFIRAFEQLDQEGIIEKREKSGIYIRKQIPFLADCGLLLQGKKVAVVCGDDLFNSDLNLCGRRFSCFESFELKIRAMGGDCAVINTTAMNYDVNLVQAALQGFDGIYCLCPGKVTALKKDDEFIRALRKIGLPLVTSDYFGAEQTNSVNEDWDWAVHEIIRHLKQQGYSNIIMASYSPLIANVFDWAGMREKAFIKYGRQEKFTLTDADVLRVPEGNWRGGNNGIIDAGRNVGKLIFQEGKRYDAILAVNDLLAIGIMEMAVQEGIDIPGNYALAGIDNIPLAMMTGLTSVSHTSTRNGIVAAEILSELISGCDENRIRCQKIRPQLICRKTTAGKKSE